MAITIPSVFESVAPNFKVDKAFIKKLHHFQIWFKTANPDHIAFFGSNLIGVHKMRFNPSDKDDWFENILGIDELSLIDGILTVDGLDPNWKRANDSFNLSTVWLLHKVFTSKYITQKEREQGLMDVILILQYKLLSSLMAWFFRYPADEATMLATYARMSRKFSLKVAGSWSVLLDQRGKELISPRSIHYKTFTKFDQNKSIIYMISDIQGRLREIVKAVTALFYKIKEEGGKISSDNPIDHINGESVLKEKSRHYSTLIRYCFNTLDEKGSWVKTPLVDAIVNLIPNLSPKLLNDTLLWMSAHHLDKKYQSTMESLINETLIHAFEFINKNRTLYAKSSGLIPLMSKLKGVYSASRMSDPNLIKIKDHCEKVVKWAVGHRGAAMTSSVRTGIQLYVVLRTMAMNYYRK